jgi:hypothetical protein
LWTRSRRRRRPGSVSSAGLRGEVRYRGTHCGNWDSLLSACSKRTIRPTGTKRRCDEEGYRDWAHDIATRLAGRHDVTSGELARILTASLAERQLFCDLLTHVTLNLEREVSFERVHAFKSVAIIAVGTLVDAITAASTLNHDQASDLIIGVIAMTAPLW